MSTGFRLGVLVSGGGSNLQAILDGCASGAIPAEVAVVVSNKKKAFGLERARKAGVATQWISHRNFDSREAFDAAVVEVLRTAQVDLVVLAGFMRILSNVLLDAFPDRVINIHPSLLPAFPGIDGQGQAWEYGAKIAGATVHFVDQGTDSGPVIAQAAVPVRATDSRDDLQQRILAQEHRILPLAVRLIAEGKVRREGRRVTVEDAQLQAPVSEALICVG